MIKKENYIESLISLSKKYLPLIIETIYVDQATLNLSGALWHFNSLCAWRLSRDNKVISGHLSQNKEASITSLKGVSIVSIITQSRFIQVDPVFVLSDGQILEIFSTDTYEPWTFSIDNEPMYCASPAEPYL